MSLWHVYTSRLRFFFFFQSNVWNIVNPAPPTCQITIFWILRIYGFSDTKEEVSNDRRKTGIESHLVDFFLKKPIQVTRAELNYETEILYWTLQKFRTAARVVPKSRNETQRSVGAIVMLMACGVRKYRDFVLCNVHGIWVSPESFSLAQQLS